MASFSSNMVMGVFSSRLTCIKLQANCLFRMTLYLDKSVPITLATEGMNDLSIVKLYQ